MSETIVGIIGNESLQEEYTTKEARGDAVDQVIGVLRDVAEQESPGYDYSLLPAQFKDGFEIAAILTDSRYVGESQENGGLVRYLQGSFRDVAIQFAIEHSKPDVTDPEDVVVAWGVRRISDSEKGKVPKSVRLPSSIFNAVLAEIGKQKVVNWPELPQAA